MRLVPKARSAGGSRADRCCKTALWGSVATALCCLTPILVFLLGGVGLAFLTPYLDYLLAPLFGTFLVLGFYGWMRAEGLSGESDPRFWLTMQSTQAIYRGAFIPRITVNALNADFLEIASLDVPRTYRGSNQSCW